jgi:hypothetical protein
MSFADLKRNSSSNFDKLNKELSKLNTSNQSNNADDRLWRCATDKAGNGYAVIRFLPAPNGEDFPFVRIWDHGFQGPGGWYIEKSLTTLGEADPVSEYNSKLWNSGLESDKEIARKQKRRLSYYSNIYVVKDPANPANEGKVFLYKYGKKIFDKIQDLMAPQFEDEQPVNPFDFWNGANFKLKVRNVEGYPNYDKSEFETPGPLSNDDDELEMIYKKQYPLQEMLERKNFKTYDELKTKLNKALGLNVESARQAQYIPEEPAQQERVRAAEPLKADTAPSISSDDDDDLDWFKQLADED